MPKDNEVDEKVVAFQVRRRFWNGAPWSAWETFNSPEERDASIAPLIGSEWQTQFRDLSDAATVAELRARADAAERRVGELEADARRYRHLRDNANPDSDEGFAVTTEAMNGWGKWYTVHISGADLDSAIDTATGADPT